MNHITNQAIVSAAFLYNTTGGYWAGVLIYKGDDSTYILHIEENKP